MGVNCIDAAATELREPGIELYHGIFLLAARQGDEAKEYIEIARKDPTLPEEKALLDRVRRD